MRPIGGAERGLAVPDEADLHEAMQAALAQADLAVRAGELPYGAVVIGPDGRIVAAAQDRVARERDPTAHGEILAVRQAVAAVGPDLAGHVLVSTVEPCAMCATAAWWARIDGVAYGLSQAQTLALHPGAMDEAGLTVEAAQAPFRRRMWVRAGLGQAQSAALWQVAAGKDGPG